jgi:hypothetical protein
MSTVLTGVRLRLVSNQRHHFEDSEVFGQLPGEYGTLLEWSAISQPTAEEVEERSHDAVLLLFSDLNLEKT